MKTRTPNPPPQAPPTLLPAESYVPPITGSDKQNLSEVAIRAWKEVGEEKFMTHCATCPAFCWTATTPSQRARTRAAIATWNRLHGAGR